MVMAVEYLRRKVLAGAVEAVLLDAVAAEGVLASLSRRECASLENHVDSPMKELAELVVEVTVLDPVEHMVDREGDLVLKEAEVMEAALDKESTAVLPHRRGFFHMETKLKRTANKEEWEDMGNKQLEALVSRYPVLVHTVSREVLEAMANRREASRVVVTGNKESKVILSSSL